MSLHKRGWITIIAATIMGLFGAKSKDEATKVVVDTTATVVKAETGVDIKDSKLPE